MKLRHFLLISAVFCLTLVRRVSACTNLIVSPGASTDGSTIVTYNADSASLYGLLYHYPATTGNPPTETRSIFDWDSGRPLGSIPEAANTFNVVGNMNERGLTIAETTFGGVSLLSSQPGALIDYGSLIWITLQRASSAREAIKTIDWLMQTYGYASSGESFSIADGKEAWIMEIIGKGSFERGAVWVAQRLPEGSICAHANQARTTTFPQGDPENCLFSSDVVLFARKAGLYPQDAEAFPDTAFDFSAAYDPISFSGARFCDARVWALFGAVLGSDFLDQYQAYASGQNLTQRMPLFVFPPAGGKVTVKQAMSLMRGHYEGTALDMAGIVVDGQSDVGAAFASIPYRAHPLTWSASEQPGKTFLNERSVSTQQTGWNFVAVTRGWMAPPLRGLLWFGVDDSSTTVRLPVYASSTSVSPAFYGKGPQDGVTPPMMVFDPKTAFYAFNLVANWAYSRWSVMYPELLDAITSKEEELAQAVLLLDEKALAMLEAGEKESAVVQALTQWSAQAGQQLVAEWNALFGRLFVKYRDGYLITPDSANLACGCAPASLGYPDAWYGKIASSTGDHLLVPQTASLEGREGAAAAAAHEAAKLVLLGRR